MSAKADRGGRPKPCADLLLLSRRTAALTPPRSASRIVPPLEGEGSSSSVLRRFRHLQIGQYLLVAAELRLRFLFRNSGAERYVLARFPVGWR